MNYNTLNIEDIAKDLNITLEEAKETIKKNTRHYIKRQMTFFSHQFKITWIKDKFDIMGRLNG